MHAAPLKFKCRGECKFCIPAASPIAPNGDRRLTPTEYDVEELGRFCHDLDKATSHIGSLTLGCAPNYFAAQAERLRLFRRRLDR
jgi:hypothetical protein